MNSGVIDVKPSDKNQYHLSKQYQDYIETILISEGQIDSRFQKIAHDIANHYGDRSFIILVILKGSVHIADVLKKHFKTISSSSPFNMPQFEYLRCKSYVNDQSTGTVQLMGLDDHQQLLKDKEVLIVEDIVDTGKTLQKLESTLTNLGVKSVATCVFIKKLGVDCVYESSINFLGFTGPNLFYIGAGMDYNEQFRDLVHLSVINQKGIDYFKQ